MAPKMGCANLDQDRKERENEKVKQLSNKEKTESCREGTLAA